VLWPVMGHCRGLPPVNEVSMNKGVQVGVIVINSLWLAPFTSGISIVVGVIALVMVLGHK
jgi:hypothetical protein